MRATADVEPLLRGKSQITVTEMPYGVGAERVIAKVKELVTGKKLQGISDIKDLTDRHRGTQLVIEVKAGFNPQAVLAELYRLTPLEESFGINNLALVDGQPRTLGLKELLQVFLDHRVDVVTRRSRYRLRKAQERAHLVEGLLLALANIDEVVRIIRASADVAEARAALTAAFALSDVQAGYILDMQLRRLVALEVEKLEQELAELRARIAELEAILGDDKALKKVIDGELKTIAAEHGTPRRTVLVGGDLKALVAKRADSLEVVDEPCYVVLSSAGLVARTPLHPETDGGGRRRTGRVRHDVVVSTARTTTRGLVGLVTSAGRVVRANVLDLPAVPGVTTGALSVRGGAPVSEFAALERGERVLALTAMSMDGPGLALGTKQGVVKRVTPDWSPEGRGRSRSSRSGRRRGGRAPRARRRRGGAGLLQLDRRPAALPGLGRAAAGTQRRRHGGHQAGRGRLRRGVQHRRPQRAGGCLDVVDEPLVVTGGGLPPEGRSRPTGHARGVVSSVKVTPLSEYPRKGGRPGACACSACSPGRRSWCSAGPGAGRRGPLQPGASRWSCRAPTASATGRARRWRTPPASVGRPHVAG
jgi:DNA gyrase subunit A